MHLKIFQTVGRFLRVKNIPSFVIEHVAQRLGVDCNPLLVYTDSTLYRHHVAVLGRLGITSWGTAARQVARRTMTTIAETRIDPADLINAAIDALVRGRFELPTLDALRRLAATVHSAINTAQWHRMSTQVSERQRSALDRLLVVDLNTQHSPFAELCRAPGRASRKNLKILIDRYQWLQTLPDPTAALTSVADAKILQWANEATRLKVPELREYIAARRETLLLAVIRQARGQVLDDLTKCLGSPVRSRGRASST